MKKVSNAFGRGTGAVLLSALTLIACVAARADEFFTGKPNFGWWFAEIKCETPDTRPVWFGGTLRCENAFPYVAGTQEQEFGVSVVLKYEGGGEDWNPFAKWDTGTHDWQETQSVYYPKKPVKSMLLRVCAIPGPGSAQYRDIFVRREDPGPTVARWRRVSDRPFSTNEWVYVRFPVPTSWSSDFMGIKASGSGATTAWVPVGPKAGRLMLSISRNGKSAVKEIDIPDLDLPKPTVASGGFEVWTESPTVAVTPLTFPSDSSAKTASLAMARRGAASVQVLLSCGEKRGLEGVSLETGKLVRNDGKAFKGDVKWERVGYVRRSIEAIAHPMAPDGRVRWIPDPLLPAAPMRVRPGSTQGAWVTVKAAADAAPGVYRGKITVKSGETVLASVPLTVRVLPLSLPETFSCPAIHAVWESHVHGLYKERGAEMLDRMYDVMLDHRLDPDACGLRWYEPVPVAKLKEWKGRGMRKTSALALNVKAKSPGQMWVPDPTVEQTNDPKFYEDIRDRLRPYIDEVRAAGLIDSIYVYGFDERNDAYFPGIAKFWRRFKEDFPDVPMMTTAFMYRRKAEGRDVPDWTVTDWHCPGMPFWRAALTDELHALGKQAWWYICCGPVYPRLNVGNEHPPIDCRLLAWQQYAEGCDGVFNWGVNYWHRRELTDDTDVYLKDWSLHGGMSGDGLMFYPGRSGPIPTIRLANVRDGVQDYEVMKLAEAQAGRAAVLDVVKRISPDQSHNVRDGDKMLRAWVDLVRLASKKKEVK